MYKIYKIVDNTNGNVYVGQTKVSLAQRIANHKHDFKRGKSCSSQKILNNNDWFYELIEEIDDKSREIYWIQNTENCINKNKYDFDIKKSKKEYYEKNKEYFKEHNKLYYNFKNSWGGHPRSNNNLLQIDVNIFN
jgi:hypothetical protein